MEKKRQKQTNKKEYIGENVTCKGKHLTNVVDQSIIEIVKRVIDIRIKSM